MRDARRVRDALGLNNLHFLCSYRIPEASFNTVADDIFREVGVSIVRHDGQTMASSFRNWEMTGNILDLFGIDASQSRPLNSTPTHAKIIAADSFLAFSNDATDFRQAVKESAVVAVVFSASTDLTRPNLVSEVTQHLGLEDPGHERQIESVIDRLIQRRDLSVASQGYIVLAEDKRGTLTTASHIMTAEKEQYISEITAFLESASVQRVVDPDVISSVVDTAGAAALASGLLFSSRITNENGRTPHRAVRDRLANLNASLDAAGIADGIDTRNSSILRIAEITAGSPYGQSLAAAELFFHIAKLDGDSLAIVLGDGIDTGVILDAPVAIPMLSSLLYEPAGSRFSHSAHRLYRSSQRHHVQLWIPVDYVEESATHLIRAVRNYRTIVNDDVDLAGSKNAFVSHFVAMRSVGNERSFRDYIEGYGVGFDEIASSETQTARNQIMGRVKARMAALYREYAIEPRPLGDPSQRAYDLANEAVGYFEMDYGLERSDVVLNHDKRTLAFLFDQSIRDQRSNILCTWDKLHLEAADGSDAFWDAINPAALCDLLDMVAAEPSNDCLASMVAAAQWISEESIEIGARVWDVLAHLHSGDLHDADLKREAKRFKDEYAVRLNRNATYEEISRSWTDWKGRVGEG